MLCHRIIPTLLCAGTQLIKGRGFDSWRSVGSVMQAMRIHQMRGVDEVLLMDIRATAEGRGPDLALIERLADACFFPFTVGGGVKSVEDARQLLRHGADKVAVGSCAMQDPCLLRKLADTFGRQAVAAVLDVKDGWVWDHVTQQAIDPDPLRVALEMEAAGELVVQSVERDGTMGGYDVRTISELSKRLSIPLVASGGCSGYGDMDRALEAGADAVATGALYQFTDATPRGAAEHLAGLGWEVRIGGAGGSIRIPRRPDPALPAAR